MADTEQPCISRLLVGLAINIAACPQHAALDAAVQVFAAQLLL